MGDFLGGGVSSFGGWIVGGGLSGAWGKGAGGTVVRRYRGPSLRSG